MSLSNGFSPKPLRDYLELSPLLDEEALRRFVVRVERRCVTCRRQVSDASLDVVIEAGDALGSSVP